MEKVNQLLFAWINASNQAPHWLIEFAIFAARDLIFIVPVLGTVLWFWGSTKGIGRQRALILKTGIAMVIALLFSWLLGKGYYHPRPFMIVSAHQLINHAPDTSMPSDHGTVIFTFALAFYRWHSKWSGAILLVCGGTIAWSRIFLGVHWPFDMLSAFFTGLLSCALTAMLWPRIGMVLLCASVRLYHRIFSIPVCKGWVKK